MSAKRKTGSGATARSTAKARPSKGKASKKAPRKKRIRRNKAPSTSPTQTWKLKVAGTVDELVELLRDEQETLFFIPDLFEEWESALVKDEGGERTVFRPPVAREAKGYDLLVRHEWRGLAPTPSSRIGATAEVKAEVQKILEAGAAHDVRRHATALEDRAFVYFDISDFSRFPAGQQVVVIKSLIQLSDALLHSDRYARLFRLGDPSCETRLCIGDGYIFVFRDPIAATLFTALLAGRVQLRGARGDLPVEFHFRAGVHVGPIYHFWDPGRSGWNYIGEGINDANRVLSVIPKDIDDVCYVSDEIRKKLQVADNVEPVPVLRSNLTNRGRRADKHGKLHRVYELQYVSVVSRWQWAL